MRQLGGGAIESKTGTGMAAGAVVVTVGSGGAAIGATAPVGALGAGMSIHGLLVMKNGATNLVSQNGRVNTSSNESNGKRRENRIPDQGTPNSTQSNKPGTTVKKYGPEGNVQKEFNKGHTTKGTPKVEQGNHIHDYKPNPQNPSGRGTRMQGRLPKKNELKKEFGI